MKKTALILAVSLVTCFGCGLRVQKTESAVTNTFTAGRDVVLKDSGTAGKQEGNLVADKDFGSAFSGNDPETAVGPLSRTGGSTGDNGIPTPPATPEPAPAE